jgi:hypothetical protein
MPDDLRNLHAFKRLRLGRLDRILQQERLPLADGLLIDAMHREGATDIVDKQANIAPGLRKGVRLDLVRVLAGVVAEKLHDRLAGRCGFASGADRGLDDGVFRRAAEVAFVTLESALEPFDFGTHHADSGILPVGMITVHKQAVLFNVGVGFMGNQRGVAGGKVLLHIGELRTTGSRIKLAGPLLHLNLKGRVEKRQGVSTGDLPTFGAREHGSGRFVNLGLRWGVAPRRVVARKGRLVVLPYGMSLVVVGHGAASADAFKFSTPSLDNGPHGFLRLVLVFRAKGLLFRRGAVVLDKIKRNIDARIVDRAAPFEVGKPCHFRPSATRFRNTKPEQL